MLRGVGCIGIAVLSAPRRGQVVQFEGTLLNGINLGDVAQIVTTG